MNLNGIKIETDDRCPKNAAVMMSWVEDPRGPAYPKILSWAGIINIGGQEEEKA